MMEYQITALEGKYPDCQFAEGDSGLVYAMDGKKPAVVVYGQKGCAMFNLAQLKTLVREIPEFIAELEGRNG